MAYKRILTIQDISCVGQCSMTVAMPILSASGHETCILPTAILSTHTGGFGKPVVHHVSDDMERMCDHWISQGIRFDAVLVGYLGSVQAVRFVSRRMDAMLAPGGICIVDPAMADHGKLYAGLDEAYADEMIELCKQADIVLPNITEAAMMAGMPYKEELDEAYIYQLMDGIQAKRVVLTGVALSDGMTGAAVRTEDGISLYQHPRLGQSFHGTGDIFAACFTGAYMQGMSMQAAVKLASDFTCKCIENTIASPAHWYGVKFETALPWLIDALSSK